MIFVNQSCSFTTLALREGSDCRVSHIYFLPLSCLIQYMKKKPDRKKKFTRIGKQTKLFHFYDSSWLYFCIRRNQGEKPFSWFSFRFMSLNQMSLIIIIAAHYLFQLCMNCAPFTFHDTKTESQARTNSFSVCPHRWCIPPPRHSWPDATHKN